MVAATQKIAFVDTGIRGAANDIRRKASADAAYSADLRTVYKLLARVADRWDLPVKEAERQLTEPSISRAQKIALIRQGMTKDEKADLEKIFWSAEHPINAEARGFVAEILNIPLCSLPSSSPLKHGWLALKDEREVILGGVNPSVGGDVINLSAPNYQGRSWTIPASDNGCDDGRFVTKLENARPGDWLQVHTYSPEGGASDWLNVQVRAGRDTTNATARTSFLRMSEIASGAPGEDREFRLHSISPASRISEPHAKLAFINTTTGDKEWVTLDGDGLMPSDIVLHGHRTHTWSIRISDGVNDQNFETEIGTINPDDVYPEIPNPSGISTKLNLDGSDRCRLVSLRGELWGASGPSPDDVFQGWGADCWLAAAAAGIAKVDPEILQKMIYDNGDGTYTVTLHKYDPVMKRHIPRVYVVDDKVRFAGATPIFGRGAIGENGKTIVWWPILEKAFAEL